MLRRLRHNPRRVAHFQLFMLVCVFILIYLLTTWMTNSVVHQIRDLRPHIVSSTSPAPLSTAAAHIQGTTTTTATTTTEDDTLLGLNEYQTDYKSDRSSSVSDFHSLFRINKTKVWRPVSVTSAHIALQTNAATDRNSSGDIIIANSEHPQRKWFMTKGSLFPKPAPQNSSVPYLWFNRSVDSDRIVEQLMWTIESSANGSAHVHQDKNGTESDLLVVSYASSPLHQHKQPHERLKTILVEAGLFGWGTTINYGRSHFIKQKCPVNRCRLVDRTSHSLADLVLFRNSIPGDRQSQQNKDQLWLAYQLESAMTAVQDSYQRVTSVFNMTATYRHDSDIVTPYEKWVYYDPAVRKKPQTKNYAAGKTEKVAWFVSNCNVASKRLEYATELGKYIDVHIYGGCGGGTYSCPRSYSLNHTDDKCFRMLSEKYKFYLAFENSKCRDYITEKFFVNGLSNDVLPIVLGAHPDDYKRAAPENSYLHVEDFENPEHLANYLHELDKNDTMYNQYFQWKGTGEFVNTYFWCRLCAMLHYYQDYVPRAPIKDFAKWWGGKGVCTTGKWRDTVDIYAETPESNLII